MHASSSAPPGRAEPGQPSHLREANARRLVSCVRDLGPVSRPQLARHLGLSTVTVGSIVQGLVSAGVLVEAGTRGHRVGRKAVVLDVAPGAGAVFVADVHLDDVRWRSVDLRGSVVDEGAFAMPADAGTLVASIADAAATACAGHSRTEAVVAVPATVHEDGVVRYYGPPGMLHHVPLAERLAARLERTPVQVVNDLNLAAIGEHRVGAAQAWSRFAFLGIRRTGIGMGLVIDRRLYLGANGRAGEIGNLRFSDDGAPLDTRFTRISPQALTDLAKVLAVTFAVLDLDGVVVHSEIERGFDWFSALADQLAALVPIPIHLLRSELQDDAVLVGASLVGLDALWPRLTKPAAA
jgi:biotin operon repressor